MFKSNDHEMSEMWQEQAKQSKAKPKYHNSSTKGRKKEKETDREREREREKALQTCRSQKQKQKLKEGATMQARGMTEVCIANKEAAQVNLSMVSETSELRKGKRNKKRGRVREIQASTLNYLIPYRKQLT